MPITDKMHKALSTDAEQHRLGSPPIGPLAPSARLRLDSTLIAITNGRHRKKE